MDAIEVARQAAADLHSKAVAKGADPWKSHELARAVAGALKLDVEPVKPGSAGLKGGRAVFDPKARAILHEATGSPFLDAFLVSHELGHATQGDDQVEDVVEKIDPAQPSEAAPVGEERVVDYNRRQRREVQMDLFGRELLMPRPWLRALHLDGMTASAIATRLGAPFDAVAQQMLDALLLPVVQREEAEAKPEKALNPEQNAAARHFGGPYLLEAGPGTGKTQTLVGRTHFLTTEKGVDPREILVLTYSNKAAGELSDRIAAQRPDAAAAMFIGTFHAFGLDLVKRFHLDLGYKSPPRMMDRTEAIELLEAEFTRLELTHYRDLWDPSPLLRELLNAISRAQDELTTSAEYADLAMAMGRSQDPADQLAAAKAAEVANVYAAYEAIKLKEGAIDFGDLVTLPVKLLAEHPKIAAKLRDDYKHVLVDEYQDVNRASVRLLQLLTDQGRDLWAVGDVRQSIYRFRGASSFNMARFATTDFPKARSGRLEVNYRSFKEIVDGYSAFGREMVAGGGGPADLRAERGPSGEKPVHVRFPTKDDEAGTLGAMVREIHATGRGWRDQAILCKGNERLARLGAALEQAGIPVLFLGSVFERPEIKDLLSWLSLLVDKRAMGLARRKSAGLDAPLGDVAILMAYLKANAETTLAWVDPALVPEISPEGATAIARMAEVLSGFTSDAWPWDVLAKLLLDRTLLAADIARADDIVGRARGLAIWQFMNFVRVQKPGKGLPIQNLLDKTRRLVLLADDRDLRQLPLAAQQIDAVRLMTIHGSKGLEFPIVHMLGLNENAFPRKGQTPKCPPPDGMIEGVSGSSLAAAEASEAEEQECVFYVALSRARDQLFLYSAQANAGNGGKPGTRRAPSPYLGRMGELSIRELPPSPSPAGEDKTPIKVAFAGPLSFSDGQIALYQKCPRRFFYTHVLEIGGKRTSTAFMGLHDVVQAAIEILAAKSPEEADDAVVAEVFTALFDSHEVATHGYATDFRALGTQLVGFFANRRRGKMTREVTPMRLAVAGGEIVVIPDEILDDATGRAVRSIRSGHLTSSQTDNLGAAAFQLAAQCAFPGCRVELVHLSDGNETPLDMSDKKLAARRAKVEAAMADIAAGRFPMDESPFTCPRCPAFFICGPVVDGGMEKKF